MVGVSHIHDVYIGLAASDIAISGGGVLVAFSELDFCN